LIYTQQPPLTLVINQPYDNPDFDKVLRKDLSRMVNIVTATGARYKTRAGNIMLVREITAEKLEEILAESKAAEERARKENPRPGREPGFKPAPIFAMPGSRGRG
jgi:hypothetical protein